MAEPNLVQPASIQLKQIASTVGTSVVTLLTCAANKVVKVSTLMVANVTATSASFTLRVNDGTATHAMYSGCTVAAGDSKDAVNRDRPLYVTEGGSLQVVAGTTGSITVVGSYEIIQ